MRARLKINYGTSFTPNNSAPNDRISNTECGICISFFILNNNAAGQKGEFERSFDHKLLSSILLIFLAIR